MWSYENQDDLLIRFYPSSILMKNLSPEIRPVMEKAGAKIMDIHSKKFDIQLKEDGSYLTEADLWSNNILQEALVKILDAPIISEEWVEISDKERRDMKEYWLIDPLDGTKSFVLGWDFVICVSYMQDHKPVYGAIYNPLTKEFYSAQKWRGAWKEFKNTRIPLAISEDKITSLRFINSDPDSFKEFKDWLSQEFDNISEQRVFSAMKFGLIAEDLHDVYAQNHGTHHRDTSAGEILCTEAWLDLYSSHKWKITKWIHYTTKNTANNSFIVFKPWTISDQIIENFLLK